MITVPIKVINKSNNPLPAYQTTGAAGMDLMAFTTEGIILKPGERKMIPTGLHVHIPDGYEAQVRPRSGLAIKQGITVLNTPGTIDSDYRGEINVIAVNLSQQEFTVNSGDRIAQLIITPVVQATWQLTDNLEETERGHGGFGHTGK